MFFKKKELSALDIKSIVLVLHEYESTHVRLTNRHREYYLAETLKSFGVKVEHIRIPPPPRTKCCQPNTDNTTKPPTDEK